MIIDSLNEITGVHVHQISVKCIDISLLLLSINRWTEEALQAVMLIPKTEGILTKQSSSLPSANRARCIPPPPLPGQSNTVLAGH
jgi:hypothetical protein